MSEPNFPNGSGTKKKKAKKSIFTRQQKRERQKRLFSSPSLIELTCSLKIWKILAATLPLPLSCFFFSFRAPAAIMANENRYTFLCGKGRGGGFWGGAKGALARNGF